MLIKCPECGQEISDKSPHCIHCGFPLQNEITPNEIISDKIICNIFGVDYDITFLNDLLKQGKYYQLFLDSSKIADGYFKRNNQLFLYLWYYIDEYDEMPVKITQSMLDAMPPKSVFPLMRRWKEWEASPASRTAYKSGQVTCPRCGSISVTTGQRGFSIISGLVGSSQTMNRCAKCGHKWMPRG